MIADCRLGVAGGVQEGSKKIQILDPLQEGRWKELLRSHPGSSFFHGAEWARVLQATYRHRPVYFAVIDEGRLCALLAVMEVVSPLTGKRGVSLPFTDACPPLTGPGVKAEDLLREALRYGEGHGWKCFEARGVSKEGEERPVSLSFCGHRLDLTAGKEALFGGLAREVRTAIRKAEGAGLQVEAAQGEEAMRVFYGLHCKTRRRHGLPPQSYRFFRNIAGQVLSAGMGFVVLARAGQRPIAGAVFFHDGNKAVFKYGASDKACQHLRGNNLVMWEAIQWYAGQGYGVLDFGRSALTDEGLRRFKRGFGAREYELDYLKYDFRAKRFVQERDRVKGWHNHLFRWMPGPLARMAGAAIYRHLS